MLTVDDGIYPEEPTERDRYRSLLFDVPMTAEVRTHLFEVVHQGQGWEDLLEPAQPSDPVATPEGYAIHVEDGTAKFLSVVIELLDRRGLVGHVRGYDPQKPDPSESLLAGPWSAVWFRPCREADVPGATSRVLEVVRRHVDRHGGRGECHVWTLQRMFCVEMGDLDSWLRRWRDDDNDVRLWPVSGLIPRPIAVVRPYGEYMLAGLAYGPFEERLDGAAETFGEFRRLLTELAPVIDYGAAAVHRCALSAFVGTPFGERRPLTDVVTYNHRARLLERVVPDVAPMQVLGPGHHLEESEEVDVEDLDGGRRLVSIGSLQSWLADPDTEAGLVTHARSLMASLLPTRDELTRIRTTPPTT